VLHELLPAFLALDLVQDSLCGCLADGLAGIMRMISVIQRPFRSAISVHLLSESAVVDQAADVGVPLFGVFVRGGFGSGTRSVLFRQNPLRHPLAEPGDAVQNRGPINTYERRSTPRAAVVAPGQRHLT
jgi:hypothetical protein